MVRKNATKRTYQKKAAAEPPRRRKVIPKFTELYVNKNVNAKPVKASKDFLDFSALKLEEKVSRKYSVWYFTVYNYYVLFFS